MYILVHQQNFTKNLITELLGCCLYFLGFFHSLRSTPIRFSACSNPVSKSIQTTTSFIICKILKMMLIGVEFKFLNYQLNHNGTFPPKKIIFESKYIFYGPTTNLMKMLKNPLAYIKILKSDN